MKRSSWFTSRFEIINAILIGVVSVTIALAVWRTNLVGAKADDENRQGLIDAVRKQAFANEHHRKVYEEAGFAYQFAVKQAEGLALKASDDPASQERAASIQQYLLPNIQLLAQPLATDEKYQNDDGTYDLQKRLVDMQNAEEVQLDPSAAFTRADSLFAEQRWLVVGTALVAVSLFWLALAQVSNRRPRTSGFSIGLAVYLVGILWLVGVELIYFYARRGGS